MLDDAAYNSNASATAGAVSYASPTLTWTGSLNPGDTATVTFSVTVNNPDTGDKTLAEHGHLGHTGQQLPGRRRHGRAVYRDASPWWVRPR